MQLSSQHVAPVIRKFGLLRPRTSNGQINLLEPNRAVNAHDLVLQNDVWRATGLDPYIVYRLDQNANEGALMVELDIEVLEGRIYPRLYFHGRKGFTQQSSDLMRRTGSGHYKLFLYLPHQCKMLRLDPAESACAFRLRQFVIKRTTPLTFVKRALRDGANAGEERPRLRRLMKAMRHAAAHGVAFEKVEGGPGDRRGDARYLKWINYYDYAEQDRAGVEARVKALRARPLISVVMPVYNTPEKLLDEAIGSVVNQIYGNWELCIADDASPGGWVKPALQRWMAKDSRIKVAFRNVNGHIAEATNSAFELVSGEYVALLDHDDILRPHALAEVAFALERHPRAEILYSDEDKIEEDGVRRFDPFFKPGWNPDLFLSQNYLNHLTVHRSANIRAAGGWRKAYNGSQDYDLNLRIVRMIDQRNIIHIPKILYHWRLTAQSMAQNEDSKGYAVENAVRALQTSLDIGGHPARAGLIDGTNWYRVRYAVPQPAPLVSLIIPTRNGLDILKACIESIKALTTYPNYEILIVDNGSDDPAVLRYFAEIEEAGMARVLPYPHPFNYSAINNFAVGHARGEVVGLINNDITVITPEWLDEMVSLAMRPGTGCVGAKLYYPNDTIQHAGVIVGSVGSPGTRTSIMIARRAAISAASW